MELFNNQVSVLNVLFNHDTPVNANVIASMINTSLKTVKKEIDDLNLICRDNGCEIVSYPGSGYKMEISDREQYRSFVDRINGMYTHNLFYDSSQDERVHFIIRCFLEKRSLSIYELMDWCSCSESSVRRDIRQVREALREYKLSLINRTNKGTSLEGDEWHIRLAILHENYFYILKNRVFFKEQETDWEKQFLSSDGRLKGLEKVIENVIARNEYVLSYDALKRFSVMVALSVTRKRYSPLLAINSVLSGIDIEEEKKIIREIYNEYPYLKNSEVSIQDEIYLSVFLKSVRLLRFHIFLTLPEKDQIQKIVDGFFLYLRTVYDLEGRDISVIYKDLCVGTYNLYYSSLLDNHVIPANVYQQITDGLTILDMCAAYYSYLIKETEIRCLPYDVSYFYHIFMNFIRQGNSPDTRKVLVVADGGYFYSRSQATALNNRNTSQFIQYVPMEYMNLKNCNMEEYAGLVSDIPALREQYPEMPYFSLLFFRESKVVDKMGLSFIMSEKKFRDIFTPDDLYYTDEISCEEDIADFVRKNIVIADRKKDDLFLQKASEKNTIYGGTRSNNCYLLNTIEECIGRDFIKIICLREAIKIDGNIVNKIVIFNSAGTSLFSKTSISSRVAGLLHSRNTYISFSRDKDYKLLFETMYGI